MIIFHAIRTEKGSRGGHLTTPPCAHCDQIYRARNWGIPSGLGYWVTEGIFWDQFGSQSAQSGPTGGEGVGEKGGFQQALLSRRTRHADNEGGEKVVRMLFYADQA